MTALNKQALRDNANSIIGILENIAGYEPSDIDGDNVELRFEDECGVDTGCDVSIVDQCHKAADVMRSLLDELEAAEKRIAELESAPNGIMQLSNELAEMKRKCVELESQPLCVKSNDAMREVAPLCVKLPDGSKPSVIRGGQQSTSYRAIMSGYGDWLHKDMVIEAIRAAGIGVKGE
ncbi:ead/Ea22-like family protein [Citrobacter freundii]|uniref:ead/Ea22-like family protein n=1 Tax=Citrobacter freundii TaxID=546 RepID=UPI001C8B9233|nr:ead/Ea22-like family protein [Citrobacter freundii]ELT3496006.1 ead/Ea22-like family protein [Citrobacter freundii]MBX8661896.1 ead/Ea22-like family protein [Citrobacter freundii]